MSLRLLMDENVDALVTAKLRAKGGGGGGVLLRAKEMGRVGLGIPGCFKGPGK